MFDRTEKLIKETSQQFPSFALIEKDSSKLMNLIYYCSLMFLWNKTFMTRYTTVMFGKVYMPSKTMNSIFSYVVLKHEIQHLKDAKKYPILFELSYLFLLPFGLTLRAFWEYRAYCESLKAQAELFGSIPESTIDFYVQQFKSSSYLFMFPFPKIIKKKFLNFCDQNKIPVDFI